MKMQEMITIKSIIQDYEKEPYCFNCGNPHNLEEHHFIGGNGKRLIADKYGLKGLLCINCHAEVHRQATGLKKKLIKVAQMKFEETHTREEFIKIFGKNYL